MSSTGSSPNTGAERPQALPWHAAAWRRLHAQLETGRVPHALLLTGPEGVGKGELARRLAMRVLCEHPDADGGCGVCRSCQQYLAGTHPDFHVVTLFEDKHQIVVDQVRESLVDALQLSAHYGGWKVAIIHPADRMNRNAFNALLKTLEEPSGKSLLMLVTAFPGRLAATIRSRCQRLPVAAPPVNEGAAWLKSRGLREPEALLRLSGGAPLAALALGETEWLDQRRDLLRGLLGLTAGRTDPMAVAAAWSGLPLAKGVDWLQTVVHDLIRLRQLGSESALVNEDLRRDLQSAGQRLDWRALYRHLDDLLMLRAVAETPVSPQLQWEAVMSAWSGHLAR